MNEVGGLIELMPGQKHITNNPVIKENFSFLYGGGGHQQFINPPLHFIPISWSLLMIVE